MARAPTRTPSAELPLRGLYGLQQRVLAFTLLLPPLVWLIPWPGPLRVLATVLPLLFLAIGILVMAVLRCPACNKMLMLKGLIPAPRHKCPHCREVVA
jgi:hypothetical protein